MKQTEIKTTPTSNTNPEGSKGAETTPVRKRNRRRRLSGW
jgi:hypothetical protein